MSARIFQFDAAAELRGRVNTALSVLSHRGHNAATARLVERILRGESTEELARDRGVNS